MLVVKRHRAKLYPTKEQKRLIKLNLDNTRFVYNHFLAERIRIYKEKKEKLTYNEMAHMLTLLKRDKDHLWLNESDAVALQQSLRDLEKAYRNFFNRRTRFPKFHSKRGKQTYRTNNQTINGVDIIRIKDNRIKLSKLGFVRFRGLTSIQDGIIKHATITKDIDGKYYISLCIEEEFKVKPNNGGKIGIDLGIKSFYTDSNGNAVHNPKFHIKYEKKLAREHRKLSRKVKGSKNREKQRIRLAIAYKKMRNCRNDFLHKLTHTLVNENQVVCVERLNVKGMIHNRHLAKHIANVSWSEFTRQLKYKLFEHSGLLIGVSTFFPSSQTCSECGHRNPKIKKLTVRKWTCPKCNTHHDRDINAAKNILREGLKQLEPLKKK